MILAPCFFIISCPKKATRVELAQKERREVEKRWNDSLVTPPYRLLKSFLRSTGERNRPKEFDVIHFPVSFSDHFSIQEMRERFLQLAMLSYSSKELLMKADEDLFPLLWTKISGKPPIYFKYNQNLEHLSLATLWLLTLQILPQDKILSPEIVFYELSRIKNSSSDLEAVKLWASFCRGFSFMQNKYFYAADEEFSSFIDAVRELPLTENEEIALFLHISPRQVRSGALIGGYFVRAFNRLSLQLVEEATQDMKDGLNELASLGIENELTYFGWAFVHVKQKHYEEASQSLQKLAKSPFLKSEERLEIEELSKRLKSMERSKIPLFTQERGFLLLSQVLLARLGGLEGLFSRIFGSEQGAQIYQNITWLKQMQISLLEMTKSFSLTDSVKRKATLTKEQFDAWRKK